MVVCEIEVYFNGFAQRDEVVVRVHIVRECRNDNRRLLLVRVHLVDAEVDGAANNTIFSPGEVDVMSVLAFADVRPLVRASHIVSIADIRVITRIDRRGREVIKPVASSDATLIEGIDAVVEELGSFAYIPAYGVGYT